MDDAPRSGYYFLGFLVALFLYAPIVLLGEHAGLAGIDVWAGLVICGALTLIFPERPGLDWGRRGLAVVGLLTIALCAVWTFGIWLWTPHQSDIQWNSGLIVPLLGLVIATPWFEEKLLRHLLLNSLTKWLASWVATIVVSALFAIAHKGMVAWAFLASATLCWARLKFEARTSHCVLIHGLVNAYVFALYQL